MTSLKTSFSKVTEVTLAYKNRVKVADRPQITSSLDAYELFYQTWDKNKIELQEQFKIMLLDHKNSVLGVSTMATGGIAMCPVDLRLAFATALKGRAASIILAHNHPSGNLSFSEPDKQLTEKFMQAAKLLDISVLDHLVVTNEGYTSFSDNGLLPAIHLKM